MGCAPCGHPCTEHLGRMKIQTPIGCLRPLHGDGSGRELGPRRRAKLEEPVAAEPLGVRPPVRVLISYRRPGTPYPAQDLHRELAARVGSDRVVLDVEAIPVGTDFIHEQVAE